MTTVFDLVGKIGLDGIDGVNKDIDGLKGKLATGLGTAAKTVGVGLLAAGTAAIGMGVASVKSFAETGDQLQKLAIKTGFSTEALSELKYAADLSGSSIEGIQTSVRKMQMTIVDAGDGMSTATDAFDKLGLSIEDISKMTPEEQFSAITSALADITDPTQKAALSMDIFGKSGTDLLPMLEGGAEGLNAMRQEAKDLGLVMSQEDADAAAEFNDSLTKIQGAFSGLMNQIARGVLPALKPLITAFQDLITALPIEEIAKLIAGLLPPLVDLMLRLLKAIPVDVMIKFVTSALNPMLKILESLLPILEPILLIFGNLLEILTPVLNVLTPILELLAKAIAFVIELALKFAPVTSVLNLLTGKKLDFSLPSFGSIPSFASGGIVTSPTLAMVGEAGPEAVIPLNQISGTRVGNQQINLFIDGEQVTTVIERRMNNKLTLQNVTGY